MERVSKREVKRIIDEAVKASVIRRIYQKFGEEGFRDELVNNKYLANHNGS